MSDASEKLAHPLGLAKIQNCIAIFLLLFACAATGCDRKPPAPPAPPPAAVTVAYPVQREVVELDSYTGYLQAPESVNVVARVSGLVTATPFTEGAIVKKGDLLFVIDVRPFQADLDAKIADQAKAEAELALAHVTLKRLIGLRKDNAISQQDYDNANGNVDTAAASVASAKAAVEASRLNVQWCQVTSPIDGRVSNRLVTVGNFVNGGAGTATMLTTVQSVNPMYCYVDIDEHSFLKYQKLAAEKKRASIRDGRIPCFIQLANEIGYPHIGVVDFVDNHVDPTTGTLLVRGVLDNSSGLLTPGFFANMRIPGTGRYQALLIPDSAIGNDQDRRNVLVVGKDNIVEPHVVELGALFGNLRSIISGIKPDDRIIINGQMHARPGSPVAPTEGPIKIDPAAFADEGSAATQALPTTEAATADKLSATPATDPSTEPTTGNNP